MNIAVQGYAGPTMSRFEFLKQFKLTEYKHKKEPVVVFGRYDDEDLEVINKHESIVFLIWMGKDSLETDLNLVSKTNIIHCTWLPAVCSYLQEKGVACYLLKMPVKETPYPNPIVKGKMVYVYLQKTKPEYHGSKRIKQLNLTDSLLIGDHSIDRQAWYAGINNMYYSKVFIGLALSEYAGGAMSILEMGVRGIKVITNVLTLPNCIPWKANKEIESAIKKESELIGTKDESLIEEMYSMLVKDISCFNFNQMLKI